MKGSRDRQRRPLIKVDCIQRAQSVGTVLAIQAQGPAFLSPVPTEKLSTARVAETPVPASLAEQCAARPITDPVGKGWGGGQAIEEDS